VRDQAGGGDRRWRQISFREVRRVGKPGSHVQEFDYSKLLVAIGAQATASGSIDRGQSPPAYFDSDGRQQGQRLFRVFVRQSNW
jgi:hypothetical protein